MIIIVILFLNALMVIPVTLNYAEMNTFPLEEYYPTAGKLIDNQVVDELNKVEVSEGQMTIPDPFQIENDYGEVVGGLSKNELETQI